MDDDTTMRLRMAMPAVSVTYPDPSLPRRAVGASRQPSFHRHFLAKSDLLQLLGWEERQVQNSLANARFDAKFRATSFITLDISSN